MSLIKTVGGKTRRKGKGLSFFYNAATTSIATIPVNAQEAPFIFNLQTADYQSVKVQGQITYRVAEPETTAEMLNFNLQQDGLRYVSEDPLKLSDRVIRVVQAIIQNRIQEATLRQAMVLSRDLVKALTNQFADQSPLAGLGIGVVDIAISAITPNIDTVRALEAQAREAILKEADDAIYSRRKSAVEQERTIKEAELQTDWSVQQKEQEIEESRIENERALMRSRAASEQERIQAEINDEASRRELVVLNAENAKQEADSEAYGIQAKMEAYKVLPVENLKAMAMANMQPEQLMAMAFESMAQNAGKIGELNIAPEMFGRMMKKAASK